MDFKQLEQYFISELAVFYDQEEARQLFYLAVTSIFDWNRTQLLIHNNEIPDDDQLLSYRKLLNELKDGKPLQYVLQETWFYGLKFKVNPAVLIPRPETEELVAWILETVAAEKLDETYVLDIGTGSGCIAITLKKNLSNAQVSALDVSAAAIAVASENAALNETPVNFIPADILSYQSNVKYNLIVSNPPYITEQERQEMHQNVLDHEPHLALFVSDDNPLIFYKAIADFALRQLQPQGRLFFEINEYLGIETVEMLKDKGFKNISLRKDMQGKDRMICCNI
ncbi:peptide chain release factor N(5)-glutamine methyltransferase [Pedobacter sp. L105]|uniref:peptide chain release factor N(5)-glutamine methyltransferase n=1 Tax=Pedobacter sp. L105 TaxID=1641871 RepID=UPI00131CAEAC|nr:peptide chain release factor N(5)-glutamine methyltransferase [Pedobacter sp. L105]